MQSLPKSLLLVALMFASQVHAKESAEYLVKYKNNSVINVLTSPTMQQHLKIEDQLETGRLFKVVVDADQKIEVLRTLLKSPSVEYVVPNFQLHAYKVSPKTMLQSASLKQQWAIGKVNAEKAWQRAGNKGSRKVVVAVIDTGVDYNHPSLKANMVPGYNFKDNNNDPMDKTGQNPGHGTHCSGIVGATGLVDGGTIGISPDVSIMPLRFLDENGSGSLDAAVKAIDYAVSKKVDVISASWGASVSRDQAKPLLEAIKRADDAGIIFVAAAANDGNNNDKVNEYPANSGFPGTITVAASGPNDEKPDWSNYGRASVHVASPGLDIMSTLPNNSYGNLSGTSMATPLVSGLVAFLKAQDSSLNGVQMRALLQTTGAGVHIETACHCRVDAFAAVDAVLAKKMFVAPAAGTLAVGDKMNVEVVYGKGPYQFTSSNTSVATVDNAGVITAVANGEVTVSVKDAAGKTANSLTYYVGASNNPPDNGGGGGGGGEQPQPPGGDPGQCPVGDPQTCAILCQIQPDLPFCQK